MTSAWASIKLGAAGTWISGGTPATSNDAYWGGTIPWMSSKSLTSFRVRDSKRRLTELGVNNGTKLVPKGTILMVVRGMSLKSEFRMGITQREVALSQDLKALIPRSDIDPTFLAYALESRSPEVLAMVDEAGHGTGRLQTDRLFGLSLPLPPRPEQCAIAAMLGTVDDKIESNRQAMTKLDELFHSLWLREYIGLPEESVAPLAELVSTQYGLTASASPDSQGDKFLRVTDINKQNWITWREVPSVQTDDKSHEKYVLRKGDLLVARMADPGKSALYDDGPPSVFASYLVRLRTRSYRESLFVYGFLKSSEYLDYASGAMTGSVQKNMNARVIVGVDLRWPDATTLDRFANCAEPIRMKISQIAKENVRLSKMRDMLLPALLSGRIRVPVEEGAS